MARTTENLKSEVIKVRVSEEQAERLRSSGNVSEAIRKLIDGNVPHIQTEIKPNLDEYVPRKEYERVLKELEAKNNVPQSYGELESYCSFFGVEIEEFVKQLVEKITSGQIGYEDGEIVTYGDVDLSRFKEVCHDKGVPIEKAIEKCIQMILRS